MRLQKILDIEYIKSMYINEQKSLREIGLLLQVDHATIKTRLIASGVQLHSKEEIQKSRIVNCKPTKQRHKPLKKYLCDCGNNISRKTKYKNGKCRICMGLSNKGELNSTWKGGKPNCILCNKKLSTYKLVNNLCRICNDNIKGKDHWNWKGGSKGRNLNSKEYRFWRKEVFKRDNYTCQRCNKMGIYLHAHHIIRWVDSIELRYIISNGLTLCNLCHKKEHGWKVKE